MPFASLGLIPELTRALADRGYTAPTPVQERVIPEILAGRDVLAGAQTGTGKTAGFTLPILQRLQGGSPSRSPRVLILVPTRELAAQVNESIASYGKYLRHRSLQIFGGVSINPQIENLRRGADILVATPGRLLDHVQQRTVDLSRIEIFVLDEADRMLDMGFIADIRRVIKLLPKQRQNLLFSATYSDDMRRLAQGLLHNPVEIEVARRNAAVEAVEQRAYISREGSEARAAVAFDSGGRLVAGAGVHAYQARRQSTLQTVAAGWHRSRCDSRQQEPERTHAGAFRFQELSDSRVGRDRSGIARARYQRAAACRELRAAQCARGLRASNRPHRPSRRDGTRGVAGVVR